MYTYEKLNTSRTTTLAKVNEAKHSKKYAKLNLSLTTPVKFIGNLPPSIRGSVL